MIIDANFDAIFFFFFFWWHAHTNCYVTPYRYIRFRRKWYQNVRKTWGKKVIKRQFQIPSGCGAISENVEGGPPGPPPPPPPPPSTVSLKWKHPQWRAAKLNSRRFWWYEMYYYWFTNFRTHLWPYKTMRRPWSVSALCVVTLEYYEEIGGNGIL